MFGEFKKENKNQKQKEIGTLAGTCFCTYIH